MSLRDDLCAQRAATEQIDRALAEIEQRLASRNTAHLVGRARSLIAAAQDFVSQALRQPLDERVDGRLVPEVWP